MIGVFAVVGTVKLARELRRYLRMRRRMLGLGLKRNVRPLNLVPNIAGLLIGAAAATAAIAGDMGTVAAGLSAWLAAYSALCAAMELAA